MPPTPKKGKTKSKNNGAPRKKKKIVADVEFTFLALNKK